jgi:hypothetical protein
MIKELVKRIFRQQPFQTHDFFPIFIINDHAPCSVKERKQANLRHAIFALEHLLAHIQPEIPIDKIGLESMSMVEADKDRQGFLHKIAEHKACIVIK